MENKSLISLIEDDDEIEELEDEEQETDQRKKRFQLATSIINFITNRRDKSGDKERAVLESLFVPSTKDQSKQLESLASNTDEIVFATIVVDSRIDQIKQEIDFEVDTTSVDEKLSKIKALNEIRDYLVVDDNYQPIETTKKVVSELNIAKPNINKDPATTTRETKPLKKRPKAKKSSHKSSINKQKHSLEQISHTEISNVSTVAEKIESVESKPKKSNENDETLKNIRSLIEKLHEQRKPTPTLKPEATINLQQSEISQQRYQDISRKIIVDNMSLRQFFNKNNFSEKARIKVISEILNGEKPAKVIGREMNKKGKFKQMIKSYSSPKPEFANYQSRVVGEMPSIATKKSMIKNNPMNVSFYSPRIWSIIVLTVLIIVLILFMIF